MKALPTFDLILFGGTGDLAMRKLLPALFRRHIANEISADSIIIGAARSELSCEDYLAQVETSCRKHLDKDFDDKRWEDFAPKVRYQKVDAHEEQDFRALGQILSGRDEFVRVFFLSTAPDLFTFIAEGLAKNRLATPNSRVVLEKPLGHDRTSANEINERVGSIFSEDRIFRIDHYLGKETVQNLLALRFGNMLFEPLWRRGRIQNVQITVAEDLGVERRAEFYDQTGAMRDMVQNHLLQLLCIIAMEPPASNDPATIRQRSGNDARREAQGVARAEAVDGQGRARQDSAGSVQGRCCERRAGRRVSAGKGCSAVEHDGDVRRPQGRNRFMALGRRAVLSAYGQTPAGARFRNRHHLRRRAGCDLRASR